MTFAHKWVLLFLLLLPALAWLKGKRGSPPAFLYSSVQLVRAVLNVSRSRSGAFLAALRWLALGIFIVALAQPQFTNSETQIKASGIDIAVAMDLSYSMASLDFEVGGHRVSRIDMARSVLKKFIEKRPGDRIGLIAFGTDAYIVTPLTLDHDYVLHNLDRFKIDPYDLRDNLIDGRSTAIGSGLSTAINRLRDQNSKSRIAILMTDGQNNAGKLAPLAVAEAAKSLGVKVYTIGVGVRGSAPMPQLDMFGRRIAAPQAVDIDEDTLTKIADMTGGKYYRADNAERFEEIYANIDKLEKSELVVNKYTEYKELFAWFVLAGVTVLLVEQVLKHTIMRRLP
jgi:Ca-activated chloride channel family protein